MLCVLLSKSIYALCFQRNVPVCVCSALEVCESYVTGIRISANECVNIHTQSAYSNEKYVCDLTVEQNKAIGRYTTNEEKKNMQMNEAIFFS